MKRQKNGTWKLSDDDMNFISIALTEAAIRMKATGAPGIGSMMENMSDMIYEELKKGGFYEDLAETA